MTVKLTIAHPIPDKTPKDSYTVEVEMMQGDGDGYNKLIMGPFKKDKDEPRIHCLLETLQRMEDAYPNGRRGGDRDSYSKVLGFEQWFGENDSIEDIKQCSPQLFASHSEKEFQDIIDLVGEFYDSWDSHYDTQDSLSGYAVYYHDETGNKFTVRVDF